MSDNLLLTAERQVFTKSGRECTQQERVELWQTPSSVTHDIIALPTFTEQLDAYCKWADERESYRHDLENNPYDEVWEWEEVYDYEVGPKERYFNLDNPYWPDRSQEQYVERVIMMGDPEFMEIHSKMDSDFSFFYEDKEEGYIGVGYRKVKDLSHSQQIRKRVARLREDEYELEFSWI
jgi:hypothetical protein